MIVNEIEGLVAVGHAKKVKEYCKVQKECTKCIFYVRAGVCSIQNTFPCDWSFIRSEEWTKANLSEETDKPLD